MDKDRHLVHDSAFDVYERASYGHGCEIQPIVDDKHKKCNVHHLKWSNLKWSEIANKNLFFFCFIEQYAIWDMDRQRNYYQRPLRKSCRCQRSSIAKTNVFASAKIRRSNAMRLVLGNDLCVFPFHLL